MNSETPLTTKQAVMIASRALCVLCLLNALVNSTYIPGYLASAWHYLQTPANEGFERGYLLQTYIRDIAIAVLRLAIELFLAASFYAVGPKVATFLLGKSEIASSDAEAQRS